MLAVVSCAGCGQPGPTPCPKCVAALSAPPPLAGVVGLDSLNALFAYEGRGRDLIAALKYRNQRTVIGWIARGLAPRAPPVDVVAWAPTSPARRRGRGFDQARLIAGSVAARLGVGVRPLLRRRVGPSQTGRGRLERRHGVGFEVSRSARGRRILVVDDVVTTGATLAAAAAALRTGGAIEVHGIVAAATPDAASALTQREGTAERP